MQQVDSLLQNLRLSCPRAWPNLTAAEEHCRALRPKPTYLARWEKVRARPSCAASLGALRTPGSCPAHPGINKISARTSSPPIANPVANKRWVARSPMRKAHTHRLAIRPVDSPFARTGDRSAFEREPHIAHPGLGDEFEIGSPGGEGRAAGAVRQLLRSLGEALRVVIEIWLSEGHRRLGDPIRVFEAQSNLSDAVVRQYGASHRARACVNVPGRTAAQESRRCGDDGK
jgi:hypothetical protein